MNQKAVYPVVFILFCLCFSCMSTTSQASQASEESQGSEVSEVSEVSMTGDSFWEYVWEHIDSLDHKVFHKLNKEEYERTGLHAAIIAYYFINKTIDTQSQILAMEEKAFPIIEQTQFSITKIDDILDMLGAPKEIEIVFHDPRMRTDEWREQYNNDILTFIILKYASIHFYFDDQSLLVKIYNGYKNNEASLKNITIGLPMEEVLNRLGQPNDKVEIDDFYLYFYVADNHSLIPIDRVLYSYTHPHLKGNEKFTSYIYYFDKGLQCNFQIEDDGGYYLKGMMIFPASTPPVE